MTRMSHIKFVYFGGEPIGVPVLEELKAAHLLPELIVCNPDRPAGRKQILTPPAVKVWAEENGIETFQPEDIPKDPCDLGKITSEMWDVFVVVAYNKILPNWFIDLPKHKTINVHPSLLPLLRGASPIRTSILEDMKDDCGVSVMQLDAKMDHGPILAQKKLSIDNWPIEGPELDVALGRLGGSLLTETLPAYIRGEVTPKEQDHAQATYCGRIKKDAAELTLDPHNLPSGQEAYEALLKIRAYAGWPTAFFMYENKRYKIISAEIDAKGKLQIHSVIPEGKSKIPFNQIFK